MDRRRPRCTSGQFTRRPKSYIGRDAALQTGSSRHSEVGTHRFQDYFTLTVVLLLCEAVAHCWMYLWGPFMFIGGAVAGLNLTNNRVSSEVQHGNRRASSIYTEAKLSECVRQASDVSTIAKTGGIASGSPGVRLKPQNQILTGFSKTGWKAAFEGSQ